MMGERRTGQEALFYEFSLERHVPETHLLQSIDRFVELDGLRQELAPFYSAIGRPSVDTELMIRTLITGYCFGIRSERRFHQPSPHSDVLLILGHIVISVPPARASASVRSRVASRSVNHA